MIEAPLWIAAWPGLLTLALFATGALALSVAEWLRKGKGAGPGEIVGRMLGFAAVLLALVPLAAALRGPVARRGRQVREVSRKMILLALLTLPMGFAWAAARAAVSAF